MKCPKGRCIIATHLSGRIEDILPGYTGWMKERSGVAFGWQIFLTNNTYTVFGEEASNSGKNDCKGVCVCECVCESMGGGLAILAGALARPFHFGVGGRRGNYLKISLLKLYVGLPL